MMIYGESKRIPLNETQYIKFTIDLDTKEKLELKNVLAYIDIYDENYEADNIIVGVGEGVKLLESDEAYICSIDSISSEQPTIVKLAVRSGVEIDDVIIKLKPYNHDGYVNEMITLGEEYNPNYTRGTYKDENKIWVTIRKNIPIYNNIHII